MNKSIRAYVNGIPVKLEIITEGTINDQDLLNIKERVSHKQFDETPVLSVESKNAKIQITQDKESGSAKIDPKNITIEDINNIMEEVEKAVEQSTDEKPWWTSRIIISNAVFIIGAVAAVFGFELTLTQEQITLIGVIMGLINIWLRKQTTKSISKKII
jgi:hypothetical protein